MQKGLFDCHLIENLLDGQTVVISSNHRLKQAVQSRYEQFGASESKPDQKPAAIYALDEWIQTCWQQLADSEKPYGGTGTVLNAKQELFLWNSIIENDASAFLVSPRTTNARAFEAARLLGLYQVASDQHPKSSHDPDHELFLSWLKRFRQTCVQRKFITHIDQVQTLISAYQRPYFNPVAHIVLLGFINVPPLYRRLLELASKCIEQPELKLSGALARQIPCHCADDEIETAGRWAKQQLTENPGQQICILVPDLSQRRTEVNRILTSILSPDQLIPGKPRVNAVFNLSAAPALAESPLLSAAQTALSLNRQLFKLDAAISLLWSPFFFSNAHCEESIIQAQAALSAKGKPMLCRTDIETVLKKNTEGAAPLYLEALHNFSRLLEQKSDTPAPLSEWTTLFCAQLKVLGWPGNRPLNSTEFQQLNRWHTALTEFSALEPLYGPVGLTKALELLEAWLENIDFQPQSDDCPLQVLGTLECLGLQFSAIWITGLNDNQWPAPVNPNPFLPVALQRKLQMPHSSPDAELEYARLLMANYQSHTSNLITSHSLFEGDRPLRPSSLISEAPVWNDSRLKTQPAMPPWGMTKLENNDIQTRPDTTGPALKVTPGPLPGGASVLKNQSLCPFRAFAIHRLNIREKRPAEWHVSESQRGQMLHRSMQMVWQQLESHQVLICAEVKQIAAVINRAVDVAIGDLIRQRPDLTTELFIDAEKGRLQHQLSRWLELEANRPPFRVVATEQERVIQIDNSQFRIRIDRLDQQIETGELILIDYKTGDCSLAGWQGDRPADPQLPLYCLGLNLSSTPEAPQRVVALAFARINAKEQRFLGVSSQPDLAPGIETPDKVRNWHLPSTWPEIENNWLEAIRKLIQEFKDGVARVDPAAGACRYCHLKPLCRINDNRYRNA